jgi:hypothetical protein
MPIRLMTGLVCAGLVLLPSTVLAQTGVPREVTIRVYDQYGVSLERLQTATRIAGRVLRGADLEAIWRLCGRKGGSSTHPDECRDLLTPTEIVMRVSSAPRGVEPGAGRSIQLGYSYVDAVSRTGTLATIFADRINQAAPTGIDRATLLGWAMAHEVGHLLMGTTTHASRGLMQAQWPGTRFERQQAWSLSRSEARQLSRGLAARAGAAAEAVARAAAGWGTSRERASGIRQGR